jgi:hypothetical protein
VLFFYFVPDTTRDSSYNIGIRVGKRKEEARGVCMDRSKWKESTSAAAVGKGRDVMYECKQSYSSKSDAKSSWNHANSVDSMLTRLIAKTCIKRNTSFPPGFGYRHHL